MSLEERTRMLGLDRKSTRLNSSHLVISYAVFCLNKTQHSADDLYMYRIVSHTSRSNILVRTNVGLPVVSPEIGAPSRSTVQKGARCFFLRTRRQRGSPLLPTASLSR